MVDEGHAEVSSGGCCPASEGLNKERFVEKARALTSMGEQAEDLKSDV